VRGDRAVVKVTAGILWDYLAEAGRGNFVRVLKAFILGHH
jgi:hypothetical protein